MLRYLGDGRLDIDLTERNLAGLFTRFKTYLSPSSYPESGEQVPPQDAASEGEGASPLRLNVVLHVIGSRGDIQPFIALGKSLKQHGHRVRLVTHLAFSSMVKENGLEFFNIGGNPEELMAFMVKNAGLLPGFKTIRSGAIKRHRRDMCDIISGCWCSCFETGDGTQGNVNEMVVLIGSFEGST